MDHENVLAVLQITVLIAVYAIRWENHMFFLFRLLVIVCEIIITAHLLLVVLVMWNICMYFGFLTYVIHYFLDLEQVIAITDIIRPPTRENFNDVYIVYELMDTDLHQIIRSNQLLTEDHCQVNSHI